jgi:hypothetical protein
MTPYNYTDPGPYKNAKGTIAYEVQTNAAGEPLRQLVGGKSPEMKMPKQPDSGSHHDHH